MGCSDKPKTTLSTRADSARMARETEPSPPDATPPGKAAFPGTDSAESTTWVYTNNVEAAGEPITHRASITSPTRLTFGFPYTGGSTVRLALRNRDGDALVSLHVANGAFNKSFQGGLVQFRFDGGPSVTYPYSAAQNGSATVIFLDQPDAIIRRLKSARKVVVGINFPNQGNQTVTFKTAGLRWPYPTQLP